jgi:DNA-binding PadR family transcriptional regulator
VCSGLTGPIDSQTESQTAPLKLPTYASHPDSFWLTGTLLSMHTERVLPDPVDVRPPLRLGLLALLDADDQYGQQLQAGFETWSGIGWRLEMGQLHAALDRLEREGLVAVRSHDAPDIAASTGIEASAGRTRRTYTITEAGRTALRRWFQSAAGRRPAPPDGELMAKILFALAGGVERAVEVIARQRSTLTRSLQLRRREQRIRPDRDGDGLTALSPVLVDEAIVARTEAELRWLDVCEARLARYRQGETNPAAPTAGHRREDP